MKSLVVLKAMANLIRQSKMSSETFEVKQLFLEDLTLLCRDSRENKRFVTSRLP